MGTSTDPQPHDRPLVAGAGAAPPGATAARAPRTDEHATGRTPYPNERIWRRIFRDGDARLHRYRRAVAWLPAPPRCNVCHVPFAGAGGAIMRLCGAEASHRNARYCNRCERVMQEHPGATDLQLAIVFADVRGSTTLAERAEHGGDRAAYVRRIRAFAAAVRRVLEQTDGFVVDVVGDEVVGAYPPGLCGPGYATLAISAARRLARLGAGGPGGAPLPFGVGVETGEVFLGNRFSAEEHPAEDERAKVRLIGDHVNVAARLASAAAAGEALVSDATMAAATVRPLGLERRRIDVAGRDAPVDVHVLRGA